MNIWGSISLLASLIGLACIFLIYPFQRRLLASLLWTPTIFLLAFSGYFYRGNLAGLQEYKHHLQAQAQAKEILASVRSPQELIDKLRSKLDENPQSAKGWYLLGRLYSSQQDSQNAVNAFAKAYQLNPQEEQYAVNYAHALWLFNHQQFTQQVREVLSQLLKNNPNQEDALSMVAMDAFITHNYEDAIKYWQHLLKLTATQSEEAQAIRKAIAKAEVKLKNSI